MGILKILGIIFIGIVMVIAGINVLNHHDNELLSAHPPDPDHRQWPQDGDDP